MRERSRSNTAAINAILSVVVVVIAGIGGIVTVPTYLAHIPIGLYGAWLASGNIIAWATMIDPGLSFLTQQQVAVAYGAKNAASVGEAAGSGIFLNTIMALLLAGGASLLVFFLPAMLNLGSDIDQRQLQNACWISCLGMGLNVAAYAVRAANMGLQSSLCVQSFLILELLASMILQVWLVQRGWLLYGIAMGSLVRGGGDLVLNTIYLVYRFSREKIRILCNRTSLSKMLGLMTFTFASRAIETLSSNFDSFITTKLISPEAAVILRTTKTPIDVCSSIVNRPAAAISPVLSHIVGAGELLAKRPQILRIVRLSLWFIVLSGAGLLSLNELFITNWVGQKFYAGMATNGVLCLGLVSISIFRLLSNMTNAIGQIKETSFVTIWQSAATLILMVVLGHLWGFVGIVSGAAIAAVMSSIYCFRLLFSVKVLDYSCLRDLGRESLASILCAAAAAAAIWWMPLGGASGWVEFMIRGAGLSVVYVSFLLVVSKSAREEFRWSLSFSASLLARALRRTSSMH